MICFLPARARTHAYILLHCYLCADTNVALGAAVILCTYHKGTINQHKRMEFYFDASAWDVAGHVYSHMWVQFVTHGKFYLFVCCLCWMVPMIIYYVLLLWCECVGCHMFVWFVVCGCLSTSGNCVWSIWLYNVLLLWCECVWEVAVHIWGCNLSCMDTF